LITAAFVFAALVMPKFFAHGSRLVRKHHRA
jgi:hypothetical protein